MVATAKVITRRQSLGDRKLIEITDGLIPIDRVYGTFIATG